MPADPLPVLVGVLAAIGALAVVDVVVRLLRARLDEPRNVEDPADVAIVITDGAITDACAAWGHLEQTMTVGRGFVRHVKCARPGCTWTAIRKGRE